MARYVVREGLVVQNVLAETVLLDVNSGEYYELNEVGAVMFQQLASGCDTAEILTHLKAQYAVDKNELAQDLDALIQRLILLGLIHVTQETA